MAAVPDVRIRLSAEGEREVVAALQKVESQAKKTGTSTASSFNQITKSISGVHAALTALAGAAAVGAITELIKAGSKAADELGKMSQRVGASVENLSALRVAAATANVDMETLGTTLVRFNRRVAQLEGGVPDAVAAFKSLGLSVKSFEGKDAAERLEVVANAFGKLKDSPAKTAIAFQIFGRQAAALIPLLNDLSEKGLEGARLKAQALGALFSEETAAAAQQVNDAFALLQLTAVSLGAQFTRGLGPALTQVLQGLTGDIGEASSAGERFGEQFGGVLKVVLLNAINLIDELATDFFTFGQVLGGVASAGVQAFTGHVDQAREVLKATEAQAAATQAKLQERLVARATLAQTPPPAPGKLRAGVQDELADDTKLFEQKKAHRHDETEELRKQREAFLRQELEAEGKRHEAAVADIEEEAHRLDLLLKKQNVPGPERAAQVDRFRTALLNAENFKDLAEKAQRSLDSLDAERAAIQDRQQAGLESQVDAQKEILGLEKQRLGPLQEAAKALTAAAIASKDPQSIAAAQKFAASVKQIALNAEAADNVIGRLKDKALDAFASGLTNLLVNAADSIRNIGDAVRNLALGVVQAVQQIIAQELALQVTGFLKGFIPGFSGGGRVAGHAEGGYIDGPGTATSDSIPAMLSAGEFVIRAGVVNRPGMLTALESLNRGTPALGSFSRAHRFADGGLVGAGVARSENSLTVGLESGLVVREMKTPEGQRAVVQILSKNRRSAGSALGA